jgi:hypothetical protein
MSAERAQRERKAAKARDRNAIAAKYNLANRY